MKALKTFERIKNEIIEKETDPNRLNYLHERETFHGFKEGDFTDEERFKMAVFAADEIEASLNEMRIYMLVDPENNYIYTVGTSPEYMLLWIEKMIGKIDVRKKEQLLSTGTVKVSKLDGERRRFLVVKCFELDVPFPQEIYGHKPE